MSEFLPYGVFLLKINIVILIGVLYSITEGFPLAQSDDLP
jgi:hypothetical protein